MPRQDPGVWGAKAPLVPPERQGAALAAAVARMVLLERRERKGPAGGGAAARELEPGAVLAGVGAAAHD